MIISYFLQDAFLAEPKTAEQLNFLTSLAYVEEAVTGVQGWWVGLADLGHEGEWVWQVSQLIFTLELCPFSWITHPKIHCKNDMKVAEDPTIIDLQRQIIICHNNILFLK